MAKPAAVNLRYVVGNIHASAERIIAATDFICKDIDNIRSARSARQASSTVVFAGNIVDPVDATRSKAALSAISRKTERFGGRSVKTVCLLGPAENLVNIAFTQRHALNPAYCTGEQQAVMTRILKATEELQFGMTKLERNILNTMVVFYREDNFWFTSMNADKPPETLGIVNTIPTAAIIPNKPDVINLNIGGFNGSIVLRLEKDQNPQMFFIADASETHSYRDTALPLPLIPGDVTYVGYTNSGNRHKVVQASLNPAMFGPK